MGVMIKTKTTPGDVVYVTCYKRRRDGKLVPISIFRSDPTMEGHNSFVSGIYVLLAIVIGTQHEPNGVVKHSMVTMDVDLTTFEMITGD